MTESKLEYILDRFDLWLFRTGQMFKRIGCYRVCWRMEQLRHQIMYRNSRFWQDQYLRYENEKNLFTCSNDGSCGRK